MKIIDTDAFCHVELILEELEKVEGQLWRFVQEREWTNWDTKDKGDLRQVIARIAECSSNSLIE